MRSFLLAALNGFVGNEPRIPAAPYAGCCGPPAPDVRLILILDADRLSIDWRVTRYGEVEHEFVAVVHEAAAVDWLVVADGQVIIEIGAGAGERLLDGDRLDPVNRVLQLQVRSDGLGDINRRPRVGGLCADIQEQRAVWRENSCHALDPLSRPLEVVATRHGVVVAAIADPQVVWR